MNQRDLENGMNGREALDADDGKVAGLLSTLPRVEAPSNFEFAVKARIAARNTGAKASLFPFLKVAAPLALVIVVAGLVIFYGGVTGDWPSSEIAGVTAPVEVPPSRPSQASQPAPVGGSERPANGPNVGEPNAGAAVTVSSPASPVRSSSRSTLRPSRRTQTSGNDGSSAERTHRVAPVFGPPGIPVTHGRNANSSGREIPVEEIFEILGIKAEFVKGGWTVTSCAENSIGAKAGVRANDVIEAIDDRRVSESTKFKGTVEGKSLRVRRDGSQVRIDLQKK